MARNDYFVIVYKLLSYFYECLKSGETPNIDEFGPEALRINNVYWCNIMDELLCDGCIRGIDRIDSTSTIKSIVILNLRITSKGIEYLQTNSMINKAKEVLKDIKEIVPGL